LNAGFKNNISNENIGATGTRLKQNILNDVIKLHKNKTKGIIGGVVNRPPGHSVYDINNDVDGMLSNIL